MQKNKLLNAKELKDFIEKNSSFIYEYINTEVLKDVGVMNPNYFDKIIKDISIDNTDINMLPYLILTLLEDKGKIEYTSSRVDTINFSKINKESSTYYNYVKFSIKDDNLSIELKQSKIGGMPINEDIVKFTKNVPINPSGLEEFIIKNNENKEPNN